MIKTYQKVSRNTPKEKQWQTRYIETRISSLICIKDGKRITNNLQLKRGEASKWRMKKEWEVNGKEKDFTE